MTFRIVPAFVLVDADQSLGADLILSDHPNAVENDPRVSIEDRHYGVSIGINLSDLRRLVLAVEKEADRHTFADPARRLIETPRREPEPVETVGLSSIQRGETDAERQAREKRQEAERQAERVRKAADHAEALRSVTDAESKLAAALTDKAAAALGALTGGGIDAVNERGTWRFVKHGENYSRQVKGLQARGLVSVTYYAGGKASAWLTDEGRRVAVALELAGRLDEDGDVATDPAAIRRRAAAAVERSVTVHLVD